MKLHTTAEEQTQKVNMKRGTLPILYTSIMCFWEKQEMQREKKMNRMGLWKVGLLYQNDLYMCMYLLINWFIYWEYYALGVNLDYTYLYHL